MNRVELTIDYTDSKGSKHKTDIEINLDEYEEMLIQKDFPSEEDEFIVNEIKSQVNTKIKKKDIDDFEQLREDIKDAYEEYKQERIPDEPDDE